MGTGFSGSMDPQTDAAMANGGNRPGQGNAGATQAAQPAQPPGGDGSQFWTGAQAPGYFTPQLGAAAQSTFAGGLNGGASSAQDELLRQLQAQALGQGPSLAQQQLQMGTDQNLRQQAALAAGGRNPAVASYNAMQNQGAAGQQLAGQAANARLLEQLQAQQGLMGLTGQMQGQSLQNAGMGLQNSQFNAGNQNQFGLAQAGMNQQGSLAYNQMMAQEQGAYNQNQYAQQQQENQSNLGLRNQLIGGAFNALASGAGSLLSDEREKTDIQPGSGLVREMLDQLRAHDYEYSDPDQEGAAEGRHVSVMAQELERSELGRRMVKERDDGVKMVDYGRGLGTMLAALADMNQRVKMVEGRDGR